jgi:hypothetical protein
LHLAAFDAGGHPIAVELDLVHHRGPVGALSTSFESWGSTQRGKGMVSIWVHAITGATRKW